MNIVLLTNKFVTGGAERYLLKKADYLRRQGHGVCVVSGGGDYTRQLDRFSIPHVEIAGLDKHLYLLEPWDIVRIGAELSAAVRLHGGELLEIAAPAVLEFGIAAAHGLGIPFLLNVFLETAFGRAHDTGLLEGCARDGRLYFLSESIVQLTARRTGADLAGAKVLPIPIDPEELAEQPQECEIEAGPFVFLSIARMTRDKAYLGTLIDEYTQFVTRSGAQSTRLVIVGDGKDLPRYRHQVEVLNPRLARQDNRILLCGRREDIAAFYRRADVYIGMGTTVLEAAFFHKPVILASLYPYHQGSIGYFGRVGYESVGEVMDPRTPFTPFAVLMAELYRDDALRKQLGGGGQSHVADNYLVEVVMRRWLLEYARLLEQGARFSPDSLITKRESQRIRLRRTRNLLAGLDFSALLAESLTSRKR